MLYLSQGKKWYNTEEFKEALWAGHLAEEKVKHKQKLPHTQMVFFFYSKSDSDMSKSVMLSGSYPRGAFHGFLYFMCL